MKTFDMTCAMTGKSSQAIKYLSLRVPTGFLAIVGVLFAGAALARPAAIEPQYDDDGNPTYAYELGKSDRADNVLYYEGEGENAQPVYGWMDFATFNGWRRYHAECHVCHGPDGMGSTYAPALKDSLAYMSWDDFFDVIINGRNSEQGAMEGNVMPAFGDNPNVAEHVEDLYRYIRMRYDDKVRRGTRLPKLSKFVEEE